MASKKAGGTAKNLTDSKPKYLGVKLFAGQKAHTGDILVRQRGTRMLAGAHVGIGKDHTLFALTDGKVAFVEKHMRKFDGRIYKDKLVNVVA